MPSSGKAFPVTPPTVGVQSTITSAPKIHFLAITWHKVPHGASFSAIGKQYLKSVCTNHKCELYLPLRFLFFFLGRSFFRVLPVTHLLG